MGAECLGVDGGCVEVDKFYLLSSTLEALILPFGRLATAIDIAGTGIKSSLKV